MRIIYYVYVVLLSICTSVYGAEVAHTKKEKIVWCLPCLVARSDQYACTDNTHVQVEFDHKDKDTLYNLAFAQELLRKINKSGVTQFMQTSEDVYVEVDLDN